MEVSKEVTIAVVENELPAADACARRHGWSLTWIQNELVLLADGKHPSDSSGIRWRAELDSYRAIPPAWLCFQKQPEKDSFVARFPKPGPLPGGVSSMFHSAGVICAPFNRLAFKAHSGPHGDWKSLTDWLKIRGHVRATVLAEMLAQIIMHLNVSPGWQ